MPAVCRAATGSSNGWPRSKLERHVITMVNVGMVPDFVKRWARAFLIAYVVGVPVIYFLAPTARKLTARFVDMP